MNVGRNDPCPCGSGLKYKKCCLLKDKLFDPYTAIDEIVTSNQYPQAVAQTIKNLARFISDRKWYGACHASCAALYVALKELGFSPTLCAGEVDAHAFIFDHSWVELDGRIIDAAIAFPLQGKPLSNLIVLGVDIFTKLLDAGGYLCAQYFEPDVVYRPQNNPLLDMLIYRCRATIYANQIDHDDMRGLVRNLKNGHAIWYSPDQDFGLKQGVMAPFFGVPAATVTAHRRLLKMTKAAAIPLYFYRHGDIKNPKYHVLIEPPVENLPSADELDDATRVNQIIERQLRIAPTQYMWFHRRFKTRPQGYDSIY